MGNMQQTVHASRALTVFEFAEIYNVSVVHTRRLIRKGELPAVRLGVKVLIPTAQAETWFASLPAVKRVAA